MATKAARRRNLSAERQPEQFGYEEEVEEEPELEEKSPAKQPSGPEVSAPQRKKTPPKLSSPPKKSTPKRSTQPDDTGLIGIASGYVKPVTDTIMQELPRHMSFGSSFPTLVYQLRSLQIMALVVQMCVLYMESDRMGLTVGVPLVLHLLNLYHTGKRLYLNIDGRFDLQQIFRVKNLLLKLRYVYAVFGSLFYSFLSFMVIGTIPSTMSALLYSLSKFAALGSCSLVAIAEIFEVLVEKLGQRSTLVSKQL